MSRQGPYIHTFPYDFSRTAKAEGPVFPWAHPGGNAHQRRIRRRAWAREQALLAGAA